VTVPVAAEGETVAVRTTREPGYVEVGAPASDVVDELPEDDDVIVTEMELEVLDP
jgi:hypothetical protein